jgi:uncharacterized membrane protein YraQ (UPF0718 family)
VEGRWRRFADRRGAGRLGAARLLERVLLYVTSNAGKVLGADGRSHRGNHLVRLLSRKLPLAAVLWNGGSSFGGVIAFIFADLLVIPILNIYRKYYGWRTAGLLLVTMDISMVAAALAVEALFGAVGLIPHEHKARIVAASVHWNDTTILNIIFGAFSALLLVQFFRTGGAKMLRMMNRPTHVHRQTDAA